MSFDVSLAGIAIPTNLAALKSFPADRTLAFSLDGTLQLLLNATLAQVPADKSKTSVSYTSPAVSWTPGPVTFGLQGGVSGALEVLLAGNLVTYTDGLETQTQQTISVPANTAYLRLTMNFNLSGNAAANWSGGAYGVKSALDGSATYAITFAKAFAPTTKVIDALGAVFTGFVLPFHKDTLVQMQAGDVLLHEFDGNLHLAFGAYAGFDKVLYAGQSSADVLKVAGNPLATIAGKASPEVKADVALDFKCQYAARFESLLSKLDGAARLHLFKSSKATTTGTLSAGLKFDGNAFASVTGHQDKLAASLVTAAGGAATPAGIALQAALNAAAPEVAKYLAEANDKLTAWVNKANGLQSNLQVAIESTRSRTLLAGYTFDLTHAALAQAWTAAVGGDFRAAFATGAVALDVGSGLEQDYQRKTSCALNVFNLWHWTSWSQFSQTMKLVYAGGGRFHLSANVGRTTETTDQGTMRSIEFYFAVEADMLASAALSGLDVDLHINLTATGQPKEAAKIAMVLGAMHAGAAADALYHSMQGFASSKTGTAQLLITVPMAAIRLVNRDLPGSGSTVFDKANWDAFVGAANDLQAWDPNITSGNLARLQQYSSWVDLNSSSGQDKPNRTSFPESPWPDDFPQVSEGEQNLARFSMLAGQSFMNFCAALYDLVRAADVASTSVTWQSFVTELNKAVSRSVGVDFIRPTALAVLRLCLQGPPPPVVTVAGPASAAVPAEHFVVTISL